MQYTGIKGHGGAVANVDERSGYLITISEIHALIHDGKFFSASYVDETVSNNASLNILIDCNGASPHTRIMCQVGGDCHFRLFENPTVSANGTEITPVNRNRYSPNTATTDLYKDPTVTGDGTLISELISPGGTILVSTGGDSSMFEEFILHKDRTYLARITNISGISQPISMELEFYEL